MARPCALSPRVHSSARRGGSLATRAARPTAVGLPITQGQTPWHNQALGQMDAARPQASRAPVHGSSVGSAFLQAQGQARPDTAGSGSLGPGCLLSRCSKHSTPTPRLLLQQRCVTRHSEASARPPTGEPSAAGQRAPATCAGCSCMAGGISLLHFSGNFLPGDTRGTETQSTRPS